jgi:hypothetical protein
MTAKGTGYEWEIKVSRSDFKADAKKGDEMQTKHDLAETSHVRRHDVRSPMGQLGLQYTTKAKPLIDPALLQLRRAREPDPA